MKPKANIMPADELASLRFLPPDEAPNCRERWRLVVTPKDSGHVLVSHNNGDGAVVLDGYIISTEGRVVRIKGGRGTRPGTIIRSPVNADGYPVVCLSDKGTSHSWFVHKLVARTFLGPAPEDKYGLFCVHHRNANRGDNRATNRVGLHR